MKSPIVFILLCTFTHPSLVRHRLVSCRRSFSLLVQWWYFPTWVLYVYCNDDYVARKMHFRIYFPACKWVVSSHHASPAILPSSLSLSRFYSYTIRLLQWHYTIWHFVRMMIFRFSTPHIANKRPQMPAAPKTPRKKLTHTKASHYSAKTTIIAGHPSFQMCCNLQPLKLKLLSDSARLLM